MLPSPSIYLHRKRQHHRARRISPLAAGVAGGGAVAYIAYRKRQMASPAVQPVTVEEGESAELRRHVADMISLDHEMAKSLRKQLDGDLIENVPDARDVLRRAAEAFEQQAGQLEDELGSASHSPSAVMKKMLAMSVGAVAPLLGGARTEPVSRTLRDDVVGLHMAAVSASMLHSAARAEGSNAIASIAIDGSESFAILADDLSNLLPNAVTMEVEHRQEMHAAASAYATRTPNEEIGVTEPELAYSNGTSPSGTGPS